MKVARGRVLKRGDYQPLNLTPVAAGAPLARARIAPRRIVDAEARAAAIVADARARAERMLEQAEREASEARLQAEARGRADASAGLAAQAIALRSRELTAQERALDQQVALARALAERILGEELALEPTRIVALAKQALAEARGARQIVIEAHPNDVRHLEASLQDLRVAEGTLSIKVDRARGPGNLRIVTEVGVLDADLKPQLERLTRKLRETLHA